MASDSADVSQASSSGVGVGPDIAPTTELGGSSSGTAPQFNANDTSSAEKADAMVADSTTADAKTPEGQDAGPEEVPPPPTASGSERRSTCEKAVAAKGSLCGAYSAKRQRCGNSNCSGASPDAEDHLSKCDSRLSGGVSPGRKRSVPSAASSPENSGGHSLHLENKL